ncbi:unnamed protein product [Diplocarpon coronariae]|nr:hypothetical protein JHW43_003668 [Diplocarpon mali]
MRDEGGNPWVFVVLSESSPAGVSKRRRQALAAKRKKSKVHHFMPPRGLETCTLTFFVADDELVRPSQEFQYPVSSSSLPSACTFSRRRTSHVSEMHNH